MYVGSYAIDVSRTNVYCFICYWCIWNQCMLVRMLLMFLELMYVGSCAIYVSRTKVCLFICYWCILKYCMLIDMVVMNLELMCVSWYGLISLDQMYVVSYAVDVSRSKVCWFICYWYS
jgi:hypothetical protein